MVASTWPLTSISVAPSFHCVMATDELRPSTVYSTFDLPWFTAILRPYAISSPGTPSMLPTSSPVASREAASPTAAGFERCSHT